MRELLCKNESRPEIARAPIEFVTENHQRPQTLSLSYESPQGTTTDLAENQSRLNMESVGGERISNVVEENGDENRVEQRIDAEKTGQELEGEKQPDCRA